MDIVSISKRFNSVIANLEIKGIIKSKSQLAERLGTHKQSLNEILNGKRNVTLELASKICEHFYANPAYILLGHSPLFVNAESETKKNISYIPTKAQAGYGGQIDNPIFENELEKFSIPGSHFSDDDYRSFEVEGDSMEPSFFKGDNVICSAIAPVYFSQALREKTAYIVVTQDSILLKRIVNRIKTENIITLVSDNPSYENKDIDITEVREIWKVEGLITTKMRENI